MTPKQKEAFKKGEFDKLQELLSCNTDDDIERVLSTRAFFA
jgi:hypothetical protein